MPISRRFVVAVFAGCAAFGLAAWTFASLAPAKWYAKAVVQAGLYAEVETQPIKGQPPVVTIKPVETPHAMFERLNSESFRMDALRAGGLAERADLVEAMMRRFSARVLPAAQLVEFRVRGREAGQSLELAQALIEHLKREHAKDVDPSVRALERLLAEKKDEEKSIAHYVSELDPASVAKPAALQSGFGSNAAFASMYVSEAQAKLPRIKQDIISLETSLETIARRKTGPLGASVDVIDDGWGRHRGAFAVAAALVGAMFGGIVSTLAGRRPGA
jgi:hypothetical protein